MKKLFSLFLSFCLALIIASCGEAPRSEKIPEDENWEAGLKQLIEENGIGDNSSPDSYRSFYEVFLYSFYDSDGDGTGDINGLINMLDYIQYMGFNGIWLMPVHPSPTYHKYDIKDYYEIDPVYGTMEDFERLVAECEKREIQLVMDFVINHTSKSHWWFSNAVNAIASGEESPYIGYYNFSTKKRDGWHFAANDGSRNWYYEALFWDGMPDLNLENQELRSELSAIARFWLDKGVSGFRLDAVKEFVSGNDSSNISILSWLNSEVKKHKETAYLVGEAWINSSSLYKYYQSGIDSLFSFPFAAQDGYIAKTLIDNKLSAEKYVNALINSEKLIKENNPRGISANFFVNHDTQRSAEFLRRDDKLIKTAWGMNLMQPGNAFVYYGEELGMGGSGKDENKRAPMLWASPAGSRGLCKGPPGMQPQMSSFGSVLAQMQDEDSILNYIKNALYIRNNYPAVSRGTIEMAGLSIEEEEACAVIREFNGESLLIIYNLGESEINVDISPLPYNKAGDYLSANGQAPLLKKGSVQIPAYTIALFTQG